MDEDGVRYGESEGGVSERKVDKDEMKSEGKMKKNYLGEKDEAWEKGGMVTNGGKMGDELLNHHADNKIF